MGNTCIVIGGGIIGLSSAYYLHKAGFQVKVIDKSAMDRGASYVNAGYLTPSHIVPLAAPGMISKGIKWMFDSSSPFYIKPRLDWDFMKWTWYFKKASTTSHVQRSLKVIKDINILSRDMYDDILASGDLDAYQYERQGLLMVFKSAKAGDEERKVASWAGDLGLEVKELNKAELSAMQPDSNIDALGAFYYLCDGHMTPGQFMARMKDYLQKSGIEIITNKEVIDFNFEHGKVKALVTNDGSLEADEFVLASGCWSENLAKKLGIYLPVQAGKGYRIDVPRPTGITLPTILMESKVAVTPMDGFTRFAGTMELSGINNIIRKERVEAIANAAHRYYPSFEVNAEEKAQAQFGFRPVSPDGLPYIGKTSKYTNLTFASGHAMMGWSLGPGTGKLVTEIITGEKTSMDLKAFGVERYM
ncbi:MAG: FAD-dependent oxidoreductase [Saprospiraceae bacterium]|nr:FAD-dependent oxidoreductase [Saprospiraceae bacterium]